MSGSLLQQLSLFPLLIFLSVLLNVFSYIPWSSLFGQYRDQSCFFHCFWPCPSGPMYKLKRRWRRCLLPLTSSAPCLLLHSLTSTSLPTAFNLQTPYTFPWHSHSNLSLSTIQVRSKPRKMKAKKYRHIWDQLQAPHVLCRPAVQDCGVHLHHEPEAGKRKKSKNKKYCFLFYWTKQSVPPCATVIRRNNQYHEGYICNKEIA